MHRRARRLAIRASPTCPADRAHAVRRNSSGTRIIWLTAAAWQGLAVIIRQTPDLGREDVATLLDIVTSAAHDSAIALDCSLKWSAKFGTIHTRTCLGRMPTSTTSTGRSQPCSKLLWTGRPGCRPVPLISSTSRCWPSCTTAMFIIATVCRSRSALMSARSARQCRGCACWAGRSVLGQTAATSCHGVPRTSTGRGS
jgi:hypothetical protein